MSVQRQRQRVSERLQLANRSDAAVLRGDQVREVGCDPSRVLAVVTSDCGIGGRPINHETRVYTAESYRAAHLALCERAREQWVAGEGGHSDSGQTWNVVLRMIGGSVRESDDGGVVGVGQFAFMNTSAGRDLLCLWEDGCPVGLSLDGWAAMTPTTVTESSDIGQRFPHLVGRTISVRELDEIIGYDAVRAAGAETYMPSSAVEERLGGVESALQRIQEALAQPSQEDEVDKDKNPGADGATTPAPKTVEDLRAAHPDLVKAVEAAANPLAQLNDGQRTLVEQVVEAVGVERDPDVKAALKAVREGAAEDRAKVTELEAQNTDLVERMAALEADLNAERARSGIRDRMESWRSGRGTIGDRVAARIVALAREGQLTTVDDAVAEAGRLETFGRECAGLAPAQESGGATGDGEAAGDATGDDPPTTAREAADSAPPPKDGGGDGGPMANVLKIVREAAGR